MMNLADVNALLLRQDEPLDMEPHGPDCPCQLCEMTRVESLIMNYAGVNAA